MEPDFRHSQKRRCRGHDYRSRCIYLITMMKSPDAPPFSSISADRRCSKVSPLVELRRTRAIVLQLAVPIRVYLSAHDEMVSPRSARWFPDDAGIAVTVLPYSTHYYYAEADKARIVNDFRQFLIEQALH